VDPATLAYGCNNLAFVRDVTIPAGTVVKPGESFTKTWKVANSGTCKWIFYYQLLHLGGEKFSYSTTRLQKGIEVGKWFEISIELQAPRSPGSYSGYWKLSDGEGHMFGVTLGVSIVVGTSTNTPPLPSSTPTITLQPSPTSTNTATATPTSTSTSTETATPTVASP
jgi:next-to-BRCA1 protein 1